MEGQKLLRFDLKGTYYAKMTFIRCLNTVAYPQWVKTTNNGKNPATHCFLVFFLQSHYVINSRSLDETLNRGCQPSSLWSLKIPGCLSKSVEVWPRHPGQICPLASEHHGLLIIPIHWLASSIGLLSTSKLVCGGCSGALWLLSHHQIVVQCENNGNPMTLKIVQCELGITVISRSLSSGWCRTSALRD